MATSPEIVSSEYKYGFHDEVTYLEETKRGLTRETVEEISAIKGEPAWMLEFRLRAYEHYLARPMPTWGGDLSQIDLDKIVYYRKPSAGEERSWDDVPDKIKQTFERLGIPEAERKFLSGVGAQYDCLAVGTKVFTARGPIKVENVRTGDVVFSLDEDTGRIAPHPVKAVVAKGRLPVFRVKVGSRTIRVTGNHPFLALVDRRKDGRQRRRFRREWRYLRDLHVDDLVAIVNDIPDTGASMATRQTSIGSHTIDQLGFARILSVEPDGEAETYDLTVDGPHNFVAEGLLVHNSEVVYHSVREELSKLGVVFMGTDQALREYPELFRKYFATVVPPEDNKFAALNSSCWSGGSFVYVPKGVEVPLPLQAYFRINAENTGQFERTLIIVDEGAKVHYIEGCVRKDAPVRTATGLRRIDEIVPDELVLTHGGRWRQVQNVSHRAYSGIIASIRAFGQPEPLNATAEHPLMILPANYDPQKPLLSQQTIRMAELVKPGDFLVTAPPRLSEQPLTELVRHFEFGPKSRKTGRIKEVEVRVPLNPDFYRLLGYYLSEGHASGEHHISLSFHVKEQDYLNDAEALLRKFAGKTTLRNKVANNGQTIILCDTRLARLFSREFGATYRTKHVPPWIAATSKANLEALVLGMWRGDGSFDRPTEMFRYCSATPELVEIFRDTLFNLGITGFINCQRKRGGNRRPMYCVKVASEHNAAFAKLVGVPFQGQRNTRADGFRSWLCDDNYLYLRVRQTSLSEVEGEEVWNLSVEKDETYTASGVISHNCTAPIYTTDALHAAVVEVIALAGSKVRYTTIQNWSNDVYNLVTKRAHAYAGARVEWIDANTGCLTGDTNIYTNNDVRPISTIRPGERVYSLTPEFEIGQASVIATRANEPQPVFEVTLADHRFVRATANHPFLVLRKVGRTRRINWLPVVSLAQGDELAVVGQLPDNGESHTFDPVIRRKRLHSSGFVTPKTSSDDLLWLLGFYLGDGYFDGPNRVNFAVPDSDPAVGRVREVVRNLFGLELVRHRGVVIRSSSGAFVDWLTAAGFVGNARTKSLPSWVYRLPRSQKRALIEGYIAADGHMRPGHRNVSIASVNRPLLEQVRQLAISAGLNPSKISKWSRREQKPLGKEVKEYTSYILYFLDHELEAASHFVPLANIEYVGEQETYDLEVEGPANFIANGIFAHNSRLTMKYPSIYLRGEGASAEVISVAVAGRGQHQDTGAKAIHLAPNTRSRIISKSISKDGGRTTYRGQIKVAPGATGVVASVRCDALLLDEGSRSDTYPYIDIAEDDTTMTHEATVGKISADQVFYLMSRGLTENEATNLVVQGFLEVFTKELPMEYAIEFNRLVRLEMTGALG